MVKSGDLALLMGGGRRVSGRRSEDFITGKEHKK